MMNLKEVDWCERHRPQSICDVILPETVKKRFNQYVKDGFIPNMLLFGGHGLGKTTLAKAAIRELNTDDLFINGSMKGNIDTLRTEIQDFAATVSFSDRRKYVIIDEADYLNPQSTQPALRAFMEEYSKNCGFILTCNYPNKIIPPIRDSRLVMVDFKISKENKPKIAAQMFKAVLEILDIEHVEYDKLAVAELLKKYFPDLRKVIHELQAYAARIDSGILVVRNASSIHDLVDLLKRKDWKSLRQWVVDNSDWEVADLFPKLFEELLKKVTPNSIPELVVTLAKYQYQAAFVSDQEINTTACLTEIMMGVEFQ